MAATRTRAAAIGNGHAPETPDVTDEVGPGSDDDYIFESTHGTITIKSMGKGKNPPPFAMMLAEDEKNYNKMTLLVIKAKAGDDWPTISAALSELDADEFKAFSDGWVQHSGMSPGE